jgi:hypothetical protein
MTTIQERLAQANPSNAPATAKPERTRIPMSVPQQKLAVPEIPGYHLHWMLGRPDRIAQAMRAGYSFVNQGEVDLNTWGLANGEDSNGNTDLGSRISQISGLSEDGKEAGRLYLMKLPLELWEQDQATLAQRNERVAATLRGDQGFTEGISGDVDTKNRYVPKDAGNRNLFQPKR